MTGTVIRTRRGVWYARQDSPLVTRMRSIRGATPEARRANTRKGRVPRPRGVVRPAGFEPATPALGKPCSIQLSYGRVAKWDRLDGHLDLLHPASPQAELPDCRRRAALDRVFTQTLRVTRFDVVHAGPETYRLAPRVRARSTAALTAEIRPVTN